MDVKEQFKYNEDICDGYNLAGGMVEELDINVNNEHDIY